MALRQARQRARELSEEAKRPDGRARRLRADKDARPAFPHDIFAPAKK
jgi:hypothetical protein